MSSLASEIAVRTGSAACCEHTEHLAANAGSLRATWGPIVYRHCISRHRQIVRHYMHGESRNKRLHYNVYKKNNMRVYLF